MDKQEIVILDERAAALRESSIKELRRIVARLPEGSAKKRLVYAIGDLTAAGADARRIVREVCADGQ